MTLGDLRGKRIGVVFSGGGAKGAYQIGCCKALQALGLDDLHAIAGSSVGAMNAVLVGTGRLQTAEAIWRNLRLRDVVGLSLRRLPMLPLWIIAAIGSEFSPFKSTRLSDRNGDARALSRWLHTGGCIALAAVAIAARPLLPVVLQSGAVYVTVLAIVIAALGRLHRLTRPLFLFPVLTHNGPLARTLDRACSDDIAGQLRAANRPVYGVLSCYLPHAQGSHRWGGWAPVYVRLDQMNASTLRRTLLAGSALPGVFAADSAGGRFAVDGSWADNVPAAPLLFGGEADLDVVFVIYLKQKVRHTPRHNSLCSLLHLLISERIPAMWARADLWSWAEMRWQTYRCSGSADGEAAIGTAQGRPVVVPVAPSKRIGNFFNGTLWFSRTKSAALIELGERDMRAAVERLVENMDAAPAAEQATTASTPRGRQAAVLGPALS